MKQPTPAKLVIIIIIVILSSCLLLLLLLLFRSIIILYLDDYEPLASMCDLKRPHPYFCLLTAGKPSIVYSVAPGVRSYNVLWNIHMMGKLTYIIVSPQKDPVHV